MKKKFLALVMTLSMVLSLVPMTALAEETPPAKQTQVEQQNEQPKADPQMEPKNEDQSSIKGEDEGQEDHQGDSEEEEEADPQKENNAPSNNEVKAEDGVGSNGNDQEESKTVAKIREEEYETFDLAFEAAQDGDTIQLINDCSSAKGMMIQNKSLTIQGDEKEMPTLTLTEVGIYTKNSKLTFKDCNLVVCVKDNPNESGATCNLFSKSDVTLDHVLWNLTADETQDESRHGMFLYLNSNLYVTNNSEIHISGFDKSGSSGIYADESENDDAKFAIEVTGHSLITVQDCSFNGMTINPCTLLIDNYSSVEVSNCGNNGGRGGIGCYYGGITISNYSTLTTDKNVGKSWGVFAKELYMDATSELSSCNNTGYGVEIGGKGEILAGATVTIEGNTQSGLVSYTGSNYWFGDINIAEGANVEIHNNAHGIYVMPGGKLDMQAGNVTLNTGSEYGGGLWNRGGTVVLGSNVALYNNHASQYGDDIYSAGTTYKNKEYNATITFDEVGEDWKLDDCTPEHPILGWYKDGMESNKEQVLKRWNGHGEGEAYYAVEYTAPATEVTEALALKAAHPKMYSVTYRVSGEIPDGYEAPAQKYYKDPFKYTVENVPSSISGTKDGVNGTYSFTGWKTESDEFVTGQQTLTEDTTLYGVWTFTKKSNGHRPSNPPVTIPDDVPTGLDLKNHYGYIIGYPVDYYTGKPTTDQTKKPVRPEGKITRAEVATIYFRMLTDENRAANWNQVSGFSDVKSSAWYNNAISTLTKAGILKGYEDGTFQPNGYITRAEFATIAIRFFSGVYEGEDLFPDIKGHWAEDYINNAANKGLVKGYEDGTFGPDRYITRAEAVTLVNRTLNRHPHNDGLHQDMLRWPDNMDTSKWYYADMQEATNSHEPDKNQSTADKEYWGKMLPIRDWEALEKEWSNANSAPGEGEVV